MKRFAFFFLFFALIALSATGASAAGSCDYSYEGATGPGHWWEICPPVNFTCVAGTRQSPIDLPEAPAGQLLHLSFNYRPTPLEVENTGHTIEVAVTSKSYLRIG